jgi:hypothetical protein
MGGTRNATAIPIGGLHTGSMATGITRSVAIMAGIIIPDVDTQQSVAVRAPGVAGGCALSLAEVRNTISLPTGGTTVARAVRKSAPWWSGRIMSASSRGDLQTANGS